jgi:CheY-like chemotaxis protein
MDQCSESCGRSGITAGPTNERGMSKTVAVIEDDPDILDLLSEVLEADGYAVAPVPLPDLDLIRTTCGGASLFLIDLMLPRMSGIELAARVQSMYPDIPLVAMSASRIMLELADASGLFAAQFPKPFGLDSVVQCVERFTRHPQAV